jgi:hypothetical protein
MDIVDPKPEASTPVQAADSKPIDTNQVQADMNVNAMLT